MSNKLLVDAGENYEYIRTITENKIELAKIDLTQRASKILGSIILYTVIGAIFILFFLSLLITLCVYLATLLESTILSILAISFVLLILGILAFIFRKILFFNPIARFILTNIIEIKE